MTLVRSQLMKRNGESFLSCPLALVIAAGAGVCALAGAARAVDGRLMVSDARCATPGHMVIGVGTVDVSVSIDAMMPMEPKRNACIGALGGVGFDAEPVGPGGCLVRGLNPGER